MSDLRSQKIEIYQFPTDDETVFPFIYAPLCF